MPFEITDKKVPKDQMKRSSPTKREWENFILTDACKQLSPAALDVIEDIMLHGKAEKTRLAAAQYIVDRAYGKAAQLTETKVTTVTGNIIEIVVIDAPQKDREPKLIQNEE